VVVEGGNKGFPESEKLTYDVRWLGLSVGTITASIKGTKVIQGREAYVLEGAVKSKSVGSLIHRIDSRFVSYLDVRELYVLHQEVYRKDSDYREVASIEFDQVRRKARYQDLDARTEKILDVPDRVQDILSACYFFMSAPFEVGDKVPYAMLHLQTNHPFICLVESKKRVRSPALGPKPQEAFVLYLCASIKDKKLSKGRVKAYYSCTPRRIPLLAVLKVPFFTKVVVSLVKIERSHAGPSDR
jgi:hypothetical protein